MEQLRDTHTPRTGRDTTSMNNTPTGAATMTSDVYSEFDRDLFIDFQFGGPGFETWYVLEMCDSL